MSEQDFVELGHDNSKINNAPTPNNLDYIQMARGLAAMFVAMAHLHAVELKLGGSILFGNWALGGFGGVDLFFVISGFVMVWSNRNYAPERPSPAYVGKFWLLRALRIYPLWWLVMGAIFAIYIIHPDWVYKSHNETPDILKSFLLIPQNTLPLHAVGWTLIHELWFYFVFGLMLFAPKRLLPAMLGLWALLVIVGSVQTSQNPYVSIITHPLTIEFIMGAAIGIIFQKRMIRHDKLLIAIGAIGLIMAFIFVSNSAQDFFAQKWPRVFLFGFPSAILLLGLVNHETNGGKPPKFSIKLGDWSYALYLIHVPVFALVGRVFAPFARDGLADNLLFCAIAFIGAIFASAILHYLYEKPILRLAHKILKK